MKPKTFKSDSKTITFANGMMNAIDMNSKINMKTRVANTFAVRIKFFTKIIKNNCTKIL